MHIFNMGFVEVLKKERDAHIVAMSIAIFGPLINRLLGHPYSSPPPGMYLYWALALILYIGILFPFTRKNLLTLLKLVVIGIMVEDFFSNLWSALLLGQSFLPFANWYTQHFPFLGVLGEPTPLILIPGWYFIPVLMYTAITWYQQECWKKLKRISP